MMPKWYTECHEEVRRCGLAAPCDRRPVVGMRIDPEHGVWYPVCVAHAQEPMVDIWRVIYWAMGEEPPADIERRLFPSSPISSTEEQR